MVNIRITKFTIIQDDQQIANVADVKQAVGVAKERAAQSGKAVSVVAHCVTGENREVVFNPDGTNENIWAIDKGERLQPAIGQVYINRGGGRYQCIASASNGPLFYNAVGDFSRSSGVFQNIESGWTFTANGIIQYIDGTIEWDHSIGGRFVKLKNRDKY